jgi:pyruvate kinase
VSIPYPRLAHDVAPGHRILIADGVMALRVAAVRPPELDAEVVAEHRRASPFHRPD